MSYLFQVSIGPVQSFIKGARRTRDLKFGSWFLSTLAREVAQTIREMGGAESLIFPAISEKHVDVLEDVPNKILAYLASDMYSCEELATCIKKKIDGRVEEISKVVFQKITEHVKNEWLKNAEAVQQINDLVEYTWVAVKYDAHQPEISYYTARQKLEALMASRKNTRDFDRTPCGSSQPKSSIDGLLESVIVEEMYPPSWSRVDKAMGTQRDKLKSEYLQKSEVLRKHFGAGPHEKLSGVDLLKRLGAIEDKERGGKQKEEESTFPSTSHMAALPFLSGLKKVSEGGQQDVAGQLQKYIDAFQTVQNAISSFRLDPLPQEYRNNTFGGDVFPMKMYDGALFYPERFPDVVGDSQIFQEARKSFQDAENMLDALCRNVKLHPNPYYALLMADGDSMGKVIDYQARDQDGMKRHQALSEALATFAISVRTIIEKQAGVRIYSGGDDVVAMLPLHTALACSRELAKAFRVALNGFTDAQGKSPTLSVGLAIVHHLHPLGDALGIARAAEGRAKQGEKDALAITVQKRGGPPCHVSGRWGTFDTRLEQQIQLYEKGIIPAGMAYELDEIALCLEPEADHRADPSISLPHVQYAALRVFQRKLSEAKRQGKYSDDTIAATLSQLKAMIGLDTIQPIHVGSLADELVVARLFAQAQRLAAGKSEGGTNG